MSLKLNTIFSNIPKSRIAAFAALSLLFSASFVFPYNSSGSYDPIGFVYFLLYASVILFLYIDYKARKDKKENKKEFVHYKDIGFAMIIFSMFSCVVFKLLIVPVLIKLASIFASIFLFLLIIHVIRKS